MTEQNLFRDRAGNWITNRHLVAAMEQVGAPGCDVLCMHTELSFGTPNPELTRSGLLAAVLETVLELGAPTLCVPTFTFSFCNGQSYDVARSGSKMGALNEYIRKLDTAKRSVDPLMSAAMLGEHRELVEDLGHHSIGSDSTFDRLHRIGNARFLFFGASLAQCLTYTHFVEERENVPYRYNRDFTGMITDGERTYEDTYTLFVRYRNVVPIGDTRFEDWLLTQGFLRKVPCGDSSIACIDEPVAYEALCDRLRADIDYFLAEPYPRQGLDDHFQAQNMVAL